VDVEENPTAAQSVALEHETPLSCVAFEPAGFGAATIVQPVPFHRSINAFVVEPDALVAKPTAKHSVVVGHDTLLRAASDAPAGPGAATTTHLVPFQRSASVASSDVPTALQSVAVGHDTPRNWLWDACETSGAIDQIVPFQRATDAEFPTAAQLTALGHVTPGKAGKLAEAHDRAERGRQRRARNDRPPRSVPLLDQLLVGISVCIGRIVPDRSAVGRVRARHATQLRGEPALRVGRRDDRPALAVPMFHQHTVQAITDCVTVRRARTRQPVQTRSRPDPDRGRRNQCQV
jgi:hypothetical protein